MTYATTQSTKQDHARNTAAALKKDEIDPNKHENPDRDNLSTDHRLDKDLEETFPASDAPATGGVTKIGTDGEETGKPRHQDEKKAGRSA